MSRGIAGLPPTGAVALDLEILAEQAASLGRAGRRVEEALAALAEARAAGAVDDGRLDDAAEAVQAYFVQREFQGFRVHDDAIATYGIPRAVLARLGASRRRGGASETG